MKTNDVSNISFQLTLACPMADTWCDCLSRQSSSYRRLITALYARLESRLRSRSEIRKQYDDFLREYRELNHMKLVTEEWVPRFKPVYIPHRAVIRDASDTTKLRVVFNASSKTRGGTSLNDHLSFGPKLQQDLPAIIARWRQWRYM